MNGVKKLKEIKLSDLIAKVVADSPTKNTAKAMNTTKIKADLAKLKDRLKAAKLATESATLVVEKTLTPAEKRKREEIAKAMERDNPNMPMAKKMAIATAQAKKVAEAAPPGGVFDMVGYLSKGMKPEQPKHKSNVTVSHTFKDAKAARAKKVAKVKTEARVVTGGYRDKDGKYHPPKTRDDLMRDAAAKKRARFGSSQSSEPMSDILARRKARLNKASKD